MIIILPPIIRPITITCRIVFDCPVCGQSYDDPTIAKECEKSDMVYIHYDMRHEKITKEQAIRRFKEQAKINKKR